MASRAAATCVGGTSLTRELFHAYHGYSAQRKFHGAHSAILTYYAIISPWFCSQNLVTQFYFHLLASFRRLLLSIHHGRTHN